MPKIETKITRPLTPFCVKKLCRPEKQKITFYENGGSVKVFDDEKHIPKCWMAQRKMDNGPIGSLRDRSPLLFSAVDGLMRRSPLTDQCFERFESRIFSQIPGLTVKDLRKADLNLRKVSSGDTDMASNLVWQFGIRYFLENGIRTRKQMNVVTLNPRNIGTYRDWTRKNSFSNIVVDLLKGTLYASSASIEYHWDLVIDMLACGFDLLDGLYPNEKLKVRYIAVGFIAEDPEAELYAMTRSSLNMGFRGTETQRKQLVEILKSVDRGIMTSLL
jgi:hypothetical protein